MHRAPIWWHLFDVTVASPVKQSLNVVRLVRRASKLPQRSLNLHDDVVQDTAFFTNRNIEQLSPSDVAAGPTRPEDTATPPFTITKLKGEGQTPGFFVQDAKGARYLFKLDPVRAPELLSGAEAVTSKLMYALGYHVPSYEIIWVRPDDLQADGSINLPLLLDGRVQGGVVRVVASKIIDGEILGPGSFKRFRDCADVRALRLAYAWVNNIDAKDHNSLLVWDGTRTVGYLIDFGTSLGADAGNAGPKHPCAGILNIVDMHEATLELLTLGMHKPPCRIDTTPPVDSHVGLFTARFKPESWKPYAPNLAFDAMTEADGRWIARRIAKLSRAQIDSAVSAGHYADPADAVYLAETLEQRRQAIIEEYLNDEPEDAAAVQAATR